MLSPAPVEQYFVFKERMALTSHPKLHSIRRTLICQELFKKNQIIFQNGFKEL